MRCFSGRSRSPPTAAAAAAGGGDEDEDEDEDEVKEKNRQRRRCHQSIASPTSSSTQTSITSAAASPSAGSGAVINLKREYTLAVQTNSYNEIWSKIHHHNGHNGDGHEEEDGEGEDPNIASSSSLIHRVLQPDRASIEEVLSSALPTQLTRLVSRYLDSSEHTSHHFLSLRGSVDRARSIYDPIAALLQILPPTTDAASASASDTATFLSQSQCDWAFDTFTQFEQLENPFPAPITTASTSIDDNSCNFDGMRYCFSELKQQLDLRLRKARRRHRLLRHVTRGSAACLILSAAALALTGLMIATHALTALVAAGPVTTMCCCGGTDLLARPRLQLREHMARVEAAARETYVLDKYLATIERLVARLHAAVESDRMLVRLGLARGGGKIGSMNPIQEVLRHLRKNHSSFLQQLSLLDEHICLCLATVNRARSLLLQQIH